MSQKKEPKRYTVAEYYTALVKWSRSVGKLIKNRQTQLINSDFAERLMLAVTEVNGCAVCAYGHTKMALSQGFSQEEITSILSGSLEYGKPNEIQALLFAQHYADTKGVIDKKAYETILQTYGKAQTEVILAAIQMMMIGNIAGLPISAFLRRIEGKPDKNSHLGHELGLPLMTLVLLIPALLQGSLETLLSQPITRFAKE